MVVAMARTILESRSPSDRLVIKYAPGLGGWVIYDGPDFVGGAVPEYAIAERQLARMRARLEVK